jgi:hypothetical protein
MHMPSHATQPLNIGFGHWFHGGASAAPGQRLMAGLSHLMADRTFLA